MSPEGGRAHRDEEDGGVGPALSETLDTKCVRRERKDEALDFFFFFYYAAPNILLVILGYKVFFHIYTNDILF